MNFPPAGPWLNAMALDRIRLPCPVTRGGHDIVTRRCARIVHDSIAGSKRVVFARSAHAAYVEQ